jgi:hypothetical protein
MLFLCNEDWIFVAGTFGLAAVEAGEMEAVYIEPHGI